MNEEQQEVETDEVELTPYDKTPSKKQELMKELSEYGITRSEWKSFLRKNGLNKCSVALQSAYLPEMASQVEKKATSKKHFDLVVSTKKDPLKRLRDELLLELGLSTRKFKSMIPKVINKKNGDWDVATKEDLAKRKGAKMSIRQQVIWLQELIDATKEIRESMKNGSKSEEMEKIDVDPSTIPALDNKPTFATE
jgi:hypothetical protein